MDENSKEVFSVFDLDHTLINANASFAFGLYLYKSRHLSFKDMIYCLGLYFMHKKMGMNMKWLHSRVFARIFRGKDAKKMQEHVGTFLNSSFHLMVNNSLVNLLKEKQQSGTKVAILSSSPDFLVKAIADRLGVKNSIGTPYLTDSKECFSSISKVIHGQDKAKWVVDFAKKSGISLDETMAFTDSHLDLPLLEIVGIPVAVNPDRKLLKISRSRGWQIL